MEQKVIINNEPVPVSQTKTVVSLAGPVPSWVNWIFRTEFVLNKVLLFILSGSSLLTANQVKESLVWIAALDLAVWGIGRFIGLKKEDYDSQS